MNELLERIYAHRSIRKYSDKPVTESEVNLIIKAAQSAATSSFLQAYSIIDIRDKALRSKLRDLCGEQDYILEAPLFLVFCADLNRLKVACDFAAKHAEPSTVPAKSTYESGWTETFIIATVDAALAGQNALLAAESLGMGGVYIGGIRNNPEIVGNLLGLPDEVYPVFGMCLGYPDQEPAVKERLPQSLVHHIDRYAQMDPDKLEAYDERISAYYDARTGGKNKDTWTQSVSKKFSGEKRAHMESYLKSKGFLKR